MSKSESVQIYLVALLAYLLVGIFGNDDMVIGAVAVGLPVIIVRQIHEFRRRRDCGELRRRGKRSESA